MTDTIRTSFAWVLQQLIEAELTATIGAAPHERTDSRTNLRNGHRPKLITTTAGDIELHIPKLQRQLLPVFVGAAPPHRPGPVRGGHGGVGARGVDPQGRRPGQSPRSRDGDLEVGGVAYLRRTRPRPRGVPHPAPGRRVPLRVLRCHLPQGPSSGPGRVPGGGDRHRRHLHRGPGSSRRRGGR